MKISDYELQFTAILEGIINDYPYDTEEYINYVNLNQARIKRWSKKGKILPALEETLKNIQQPLNWVLITEPWCGDAAHSHAFISKLAVLNPNISLTVQNRDEDSEIDKYLTNGGKSIPKLIVRDKAGNDFFDWGPRPKEAQEMVMQHKKDDSKSAQEKKMELQKWYNKDKGTAIQEELNALLLEHVLQTKDVLTD